MWFRYQDLNSFTHQVSHFEFTEFFCVFVILCVDVLNGLLLLALRQLQLKHEFILQFPVVCNSFSTSSLLQLFCNFYLFITKSIKYCNVVLIWISEGYFHAITELQINTVKWGSAFDYSKKGLFSLAKNCRLDFVTH